MNNYASFFTHNVTKEENNISMFAETKDKFSKAIALKFSKKFKTVLDQLNFPFLIKKMHIFGMNHCIGDA